MLNFTPLAQPFMAANARRTAAILTPADTERVQRRVLADLLKAAAKTEYGRAHGFDAAMAYEDFAKAVPVVAFEDLRPLVMRMVAGEEDVLWPGRCRRFAQSSGTSGGKSKYIPLTERSLQRNHYKGSSEVVCSYLLQHPHSRLFGGKSLILGGSYANELADVPKGVYVGDLSATLIDHINPVVNLFRVPSKEIALMADWTEKLPRLAEAAAKADITNISGVPSWFLTVLQTVMAIKGVDNIHQVWPNLEVFFHGGIAFGPYRAQYQAITDPAKMHFMETYNASEGFFAFQDDPSLPGMRLLTAIDVFYEFIPVDELESPNPRAIPAWQVEAGKTYALIISGSNGLWRYLIGDTVRIESTTPLRITIAGRTNSFINAFGEEVMVWNADAALAKACQRTGASVANYTAAPVFAANGRKGHHQWLIEWNLPPMAGNDAFAKILDEELQAVNSDYQAKRAGNIFLDIPQITDAPAGSFDKWLGATGKLGGQRKVPRLANDRRIIDAIISIIKNN